MKEVLRENPNETDPLSMVAEKLLIDVLRGEIETLSKGTVNELSYEYMIEAQFNSLWN